MAPIGGCLEWDVLSPAQLQQSPLALMEVSALVWKSAEKEHLRGRWERFCPPQGIQREHKVSFVY